MPDGSIRWSVLEPDTRKKQARNKTKWREVACGWALEAPTWDELHKFSYVGSGDGCATPPGPVDQLLHAMKYDAHCMEIEDRRTKELKYKVPG